MPDGFKEQVAFISSIGSRASEWLFYALIFVFPFFALPYTILPVALNKGYLVYFAVLVIGIIYLVSSLQSGTIKIPKSLAGVFLVVFMACLLVSSFFSNASHVSFSGMGNEAGTLGAMAIFILTFIFAFWVLDDDEKNFRALFALFGSFLILVIFQVFQTIFGVSLFPSLGTGATFNLLGSWNELGIFAGLLTLVSAIFIEQLPRSFLKIISWVVLVLSLLTAAIVNFEFVWWVLAGVLVIWLAYQYSQRRSGSFRVSFLLLLVTLVFIFANSIVTDIVDQLGARFVEVRPNLEFTLKTASGALSENAAFGYGPNTFLYAWFEHRPQEFAGNPFWQTRFNEGFGFVPTLLVTVGLAGVAALLAFLGMFLYYGFKALVSASSSSSFLVVATFAGSLYLWIFAFIYPGGFALLFPMFLFSGMFLGLAMKRGVVDYYEISLFDRSLPGFVGALCMILFIVLGVSWFSIQAQKYYAAVLYGEGVKAFAAGNLDSAGSFLARAVRFDGRDLYFRSSSDLGLSLLQQTVSGASSMTQQEFQERFGNILAGTIQSAQSASAANPADGANWMTLGRIYEAVIPFRIQGASDLAKSAYAKAGEAFSTSPEPLLASARVELAINDLPRAREFLKQAIALKPDYAQAHFLLAQLEAATGNINLAIQSAETTALLAPYDVGVLFQLGLLYYQNQKFPEAGAVFERAVGINSDYSNARYFLGLIYARQGDRERALGEFRRIAELNPGNAEVEKIIQNLSSGKDPLFGIAPPGPQPEKRGRAPIEE